MPAFIGAGNFKGNWNASTNSGSAEGLAPPLSPLLASSGTTTAGYNVATAALTASVGDYWQVTTAGTTNIDGESNWQLNDWCLYASSSAKGFHWQRLSVTDTVSAIVVGNASSDGLKASLLASASAKSGPSVGQFGEVLFCSSSDGAGNDKYFEGNSNFTFDPEVNILNLTGTLRINGEIQATQVHTNYVTSSILFDSGDTKFGNSVDDMHQFTGSVYCSLGLTSSQGISASYFTGDGSGLTGISAGSSLGNSVYVNAASSSVPFFGAASGGKFGLTGSGKFNFYSGSSELQVTGNIRATNMYLGSRLFHEGDDNTYLFVSGDEWMLYAGGTQLQKWQTYYAQDSVVINDYNSDVDFVVETENSSSTLWVDGATDNVGIRCAPSGTIQALTVSGSTLFGSASANSHEFIGSIYAEQDIIHTGDTDTKITFTNDQIDFTAGGTTLLTLDEDSQNLVQIGDGTDVDFKVRGLNDDFAIFVQGSSDKVGIGTSNPLQKLSVSGSTVFGTAGGSDTHWFTGSIYVSDDIHVQDKIYGLGDSNTYIDFSTDDQLHIYAGGIFGAVQTAGTFLINPTANSSFDFGMTTSGFTRGFHIDGGSDNVGIRCVPSGAIQALVVSGSTLFGSASANTHEFIGSVSVTQDISFAGNLHNASDDDTYIDFLDDRMRFYAGNIQFADFHEHPTLQDTITFNGSSSDIDLIVKSDPGAETATTAHTHTIFVQASSARVGIAESAPGAQLDVSGSTIIGRNDGATISNNEIRGTLYVTGNVGINTAVTGYSLTLPNSDNFLGRGMAYAWSTYSSARYKQNVTPMPNPIETAKKLQGVEFTWKETGHKDFGFIAEEVGKVLPQLVSYDADGENAIGMDYSKITSLLVECVKQQQNQIETQEDRIKQLEKKLKS